MSCDDPTITPGGRQGIGVVQPQSGLDYPFVSPSDDIRYLIADFYLAYDDPGYYRATTAVREHPLRIKWLYGVGCEPSAAPLWAPTPVHDADILVVDAEDRVVFDSTALVPDGGDDDFQNFSATPWGADYMVYEWLGNHGVCRMVVHTTWPPSSVPEGTDPDYANDEMVQRNWPTHIAPTSAVLDERAVYKMPKRVRSLKVNGATLDPFRRTGVTLVSGNNMRITPATAVADPLRLNTDITFAAIPGAGAGKVVDCRDDPETPITRINGATPVNGSLQISASDCIWVRQPTELVGGGRVAPIQINNAPTVTIGTNCAPCCDCPDYVATGRYMNQVANRYSAIGKRTHEIKLLHENNIERWVDQRECRLLRPLRLQIVPQNCPFVDVVMQFCNQCQTCVENARLTVDFTTFPSGAAATVVCGYTFLFAPGYSGVEFTLDGTYPQFSAPLPPIDVGNSAYVKFRLQFTPRNYPYVVNGTLTGTIADLPITTGCDSATAAASATASDALNCGPDGATVTKC